MSTETRKIDLESALSSLPSVLRKRLIKHFLLLKSAALEDHHDTIGHQAGKLAETIIRILQYELTGSYTALSDGLGNFKNECSKIEGTPTASGPEGLRVVMPRALLLMYTLRNKRDFGHAGGEVDANEIDAFTAIRLADWCVSELVRVVHNIPIEDAQKICDAIAERQVPKIWNIMGRKRILDTSMSYKQQTLMLLYSELEEGVATEDLLAWTEHSNRAVYRRDILSKLHKERLIEWDKELEMAIISPTGVQKVEAEILPIL